MATGLTTTATSAAAITGSAETAMPIPPPAAAVTTTATAVVAAAAPPPSQPNNNTIITATTNNIGSSSFADNQYFYEDEVFRIDKKGRIKFGLVLENSGSFSSDDEDYMDDILYKGEIRVAWHPDGKEEVLNERAVGLADRTLMPGDVVRRLVPGKDTQRGYCREINMRADVKVIGTKYVVKNVMAERLRPLVKMPRDNAVCLDSWVGSTKCVKEKVVLKSSCGAIIEVNDLDLCQLKDTNTKLRNGLFADTVFYPGQTVSGRIESFDSYKLLTPTLALKTNKKGKPIARKFVVQSVQIEGVWVQWQCEALSEDNCCDQKSVASQQPKTYVTGDDLKRLKRLNLFESCMLQINDKNYLKITECDVIVRKSQWEKEQAVKYKLLWSQQQKDQKDDNQQQQTTNTTTTTRNTKGITKIDKIKIKLSTTTNTNSTTGTGTTVVTNQQQDNEKKTLKVSSKHNITRLENHNVINNKERNETERKMFVEDDKCIKNNDGNDEKIIVVDNTMMTMTTTTAGADDWQTEEDEDEDDNDEDNSLAESTTTTVSTCSSPTPRSSPKRSPLLHKKQVKRFKKTITGSTVKKMPEIGDEVVTEALIVYSTATVVWQDGTVETGIPSTQLYPIHHLDDHEFFPGDFVLSGTADTDVSYRDYGVVQTVDHQGRTAHVKWFTTYTSADEPKPTYVGESEISVYDLKDHPDFQYRPGTIVIRIANFVGEDATCTAGQIIDNYTDGRVKVWWVDGHISMCWPQDLFEVGQYDPDNNFFRNTDSENDSWETESEISEPGGTSQKLHVSEPKISINLERARVAIARLEEIFTINPNLQNHEVMRKLLGVYKTCRYLDRLMNTSFFHEDHFMGLLERVRKGGNQSKAERAQDQKNRLFNQQSMSTIMSSSSPNPKGTNNSINSNIDNIIESATKEYTPTKIFCSSTPCKTALKKKSSKTDIFSNNQQQQQQQQQQDSDTVVSNSNSSTTKCSIILAKQSNNLIVDSKNYIEGYENHLLSCVMSNIEKATLETEDLKKFTTIHKKNNEFETTNNKIVTASINNTNTNNNHNDNDNDNSGDKIVNNEEESMINENDSGNYSRNNEHYCDGSCSTINSYINDHPSSSSPHPPPSSLQLKLNDLKSTISSSSNIGLVDDTPELVCAKLCALLKTQLVKALQEIQDKYCKDNLNLSDFIEEYNTTTIIDYPFDEELPIDDEECEGGGDYEINNSISVTRDGSMINVSSEIQHNSVVVEEKNNSDIIPSIQTPTTITTATTTTTTTAAATTTTTIGASIQAVPSECFQVMESAPGSHKFLLALFHPVNAQQYYKAVRREHKLLRTSLPPGVWVRVFEDRMDLVSVMIEGPKNTPYEDGMFFFDMQLGREYPKTPPLCHYISYCADRLNPNLYEDGKVCVSLLGTWSGKDTEVWGPNSTLLQVIVSIQGLILCSEPYFNEAGYEKQKGTQQGKENSRMYNEMVIIKLIQSMTKLLSSPPEIFRDEIIRHFKKNGKSMYDRIKDWMEMSQNSIQDNCTTTTTTASNDNKITNNYKNIQPPEFPLVPASRGFCLTSTGLLDSFYNKIEMIKNE